MGSSCKSRICSMSFSKAGDSLVVTLFRRVELKWAVTMSLLWFAVIMEFPSFINPLEDVNCSLGLRMLFLVKVSLWLSKSVLASSGRKISWVEGDRFLSASFLDCNKPGDPVDDSFLGFECFEELEGELCFSPGLKVSVPRCTGEVSTLS